jgi:hypothetical protein
MKHFCLTIIFAAFSVASAGAEQNAWDANLFTALKTESISKSRACGLKETDSDRRWQACFILKNVLVEGGIAELDQLTSVARAQNQLSFIVKNDDGNMIWGLYRNSLPLTCRDLGRAAEMVGHAVRDSYADLLNDDLIEAPSNLPMTYYTLKMRQENLENAIFVACALESWERIAHLRTAIVPLKAQLDLIVRGY